MAQLKIWTGGTRVLATIKVLKHEDQKFIQYYFIYDMPWPVVDRDLAVESTIKMDTATGVYTVSSRPMLKAVPENPDLVRITKLLAKMDCATHG